MKGSGVPKNSSLTMQWLEKAAEKGNPDAQSYLAQMYQHGYGGNKYPVKAQYWCNQSNQKPSS